MTEQDEKAMRKKIMREYNLKTELEAVKIVAKQIREKRLCEVA